MTIAFIEFKKRWLDTDDYEELYAEAIFDKTYLREIIYHDHITPARIDQHGSILTLEDQLVLDVGSPGRAYSLYLNGDNQQACDLFALLRQSGAGDYRPDPDQDRPNSTDVALHSASFLRPRRRADDKRALDCL